ncbi:hypothetical protein ACNUDN_03135 [Mycobacterium sp. smrl_JER01]|uniref:hypothetical protein n=1 Tax=Mycobacterium sp. smrl_JER01 TaxID=3402633 RepID=UPI003AC8A5E4
MGQLSMPSFLALAAAVLILNLLVSGIRVLRGPDIRDRVAGVALLSTTGVGALLVIAELVDEPALRTAGLVVVALAVLIVLVLVTGQHPQQDPSP